MKRINRKRVIETLEVARQGYASIFITSVENKNITMQLGCSAHYHNLNKMIVELGGEDTGELNPVFDLKNKI